MKVGHILLIPYCQPGDPRVAERVRELANDVRGVLLERLGPVVWGASIRAMVKDVDVVSCASD